MANIRTINLTENQ